MLDEYVMPPGDRPQGDLKPRQCLESLSVRYRLVHGALYRSTRRARERSKVQWPRHYCSSCYTYIWAT